MSVGFTTLSDVAGVPGSADVAVVRLAIMVELWYSCPVIICMHATTVEAIYTIHNFFSSAKTLVGLQSEKVPMGL